MAKNKDQTIKELKREVEALRAQLKVAPKKETAYEIVSKGESGLTHITKNTKSTESDTNNYNIDLILDDKYVKTQLTKTFILTAFSFAIIFTLYFYGVDKLLQSFNLY